VKSDQQIRHEMSLLRHELSLLRKQLRERKKQRLGIPRKSGSYFRKDHEYLETGIEKTRRRIEIFRAAGGEVACFDEADPSTIEEIRPATCQGCVEPHLIGWNEGEWHHNVKSHGGEALRLQSVRAIRLPNVACSVSQSSDRSHGA
jgi:hypothetical protein